MSNLLLHTEQEILGLSTTMHSGSRVFGSFRYMSHVACSRPYLYDKDWVVLREQYIKVITMEQNNVVVHVYIHT